MNKRATHPPGQPKWAGPPGSAPAPRGYGTIGHGALGLRRLELGAEFPAPLLQLEDFLRRGLGTGIAQGPDFLGQFLNFLDDLGACHRGPFFTRG
jgi:hypothetical protein